MYYYWNVDREKTLKFEKRYIIKIFEVTAVYIYRVTVQKTQFITAKANARVPGYS
jgi:hypothetical protein